MYVGRYDGPFIVERPDILYRYDLEAEEPLSGPPEVSNVPTTWAFRISRGSTVTVQYRFSKVDKATGPDTTFT